MTGSFDVSNQIKHYYFKKTIMVIISLKNNGGVGMSHTLWIL